MAEYALALYRRFRQFPQQVVLYVGEAPLRMRESIAGPAISFRCRVVDIRQLDGEPLLDSANLEDNLLAVLMRLTDEREAVRKILHRIAGSEPSRRDIAVRELTILAGLRHLGAIIERETRNMPILDDIMDHDLLGPIFRRGLQQGRIEERKAMVMRLLEKRFGTVPTWARQRLEAMPAPELEETGLRLLDARSLEELLGN
jgi:hypothetical protein